MKPELEISEIFKKLRKTAGLSQIEMAKILGRDQATISRLEKGIQNLSLDSLFILSEFFEVSYQDILDGNINYWKVADKFGKKIKLNDRYLDLIHSSPREVVPVMRLIIEKKGADYLTSFLSQFGLEDLVHIPIDEKISSYIYFDLLSKALSENLVTEKDIGALVESMHSKDIHGPFFNTYDHQDDSFNMVKAYCLNTCQYEGGFENRIIEETDKTISIGSKPKEFLSQIDFSDSDLAYFLCDLKKEFFTKFPSFFGKKELISKPVQDKTKDYQKEAIFQFLKPV